MKARGDLALAVVAGYLLGRRKKTRLALMLGTAALTGRVGGATGQLVRSGTKALGANDALAKAAPGLGEVGGMIRGDLTNVAKRAAATAISAQINALSDQLRERADAIREGAAGRAEPDEEPDEEPADLGPEEDEEEPAPPRRPQGRTRRQSAGTRSRNQEDDGEAPEPVSRAARSTRSTRAASPIRRR
jgi:hypothetical protein